MIVNALKPTVRFAVKELKERIIFVDILGSFSFYACSSYDGNNGMLEGYDVTHLIVGNNRDKGAWLKAKSEDNFEKIRIFKSNSVAIVDFLPL